MNIKECPHYEIKTKIYNEGLLQAYITTLEIKNERRDFQTKTVFYKNKRGNIITIKEEI